MKKLDEKIQWFIENQSDILDYYHDGAYEEYLFLLGSNFEVDFYTFETYEEIEACILKHFEEFCENNKTMDVKYASYLRYSKDVLTPKEFIDETFENCVIAYLQSYRFFGKKVLGIINTMRDLYIELNLINNTNTDYKYKSEFNDKLYDYFNKTLCGDLFKERIDTLNDMKKLLLSNYKYLLKFKDDITVIDDKDLIELDLKLSLISKKADTVALDRINKMINLNIDGVIQFEEFKNKQCSL